MTLKSTDANTPGAGIKVGTTRRNFLGQAATAAGLAAAGAAGIPAAAAREPGPRAPSSFIDLLRPPDRVTAFADLKTPLKLERSGQAWQAAGIEIETAVTEHALAVHLTAPGMAPRFVHLRWNAAVPAGLLALGDHWERSYGDLAWRPLVPERVLPWYFTTHDGRCFNSYGVKTSAGSLCFWQLDAEGVSLWLNTSNGGAGVMLGHRRLLAATIVSRQGSGHEDPTTAIRSFCCQMCSLPPRPFVPVYGTNDWYYAYGQNSARQILDDTEFVSGLAGSLAARPFSVIDEGWGDTSLKAFPDMPGLAREIVERRARPGIWVRPTLAGTGTDRRLLLPDARFGERTGRAREAALDVTIPEAAALGLDRVRQVAAWGYELIKHDFSTYDLLGQWGFEMGASPTLDGWHLNDRSRTNAEVIAGWYAQLREAAGQQRLILGCNTIGHLGQGLFDVSRTGDDTSGHVWERTRRMGVNTLAFRLPQHNAFFVQDADCVGISAAVPWAKNRQWLDLLAQSGTALFVSPGEGARGASQASAIRDAFALVAAGGSQARPSRWKDETAPAAWEMPAGKTLHYDWIAPEGAYPFTV